MDELLTEKEQLAAIRGWWSENGSFIIVGLVLGIAVLGGWRYWQHYTQTRAESASVLYEQLTDAITAGDSATAASVAANLKDRYASTPYAEQAALMMARVYVDNGKTVEAIEWLDSLARKSRDAGVGHVARLRLARLYADQGRFDEALALVKVKNTDGFAARYQEVRGDILVAKGDTAAASGAYSEALLLYPQDANADRRYLEMKLSDLGAEPPKTAGLDSAE